MLSPAALRCTCPQDNILNNLTPENVGKLVGPVVAVALSFGIRLGYCICLMVSSGAPACSVLWAWVCHVANGWGGGGGWGKKGYSK